MFLKCIKWSSGRTPTCLLYWNPSKVGYYTVLCFRERGKGMRHERLLSGSSAVCSHFIEANPYLGTLLCVPRYGLASMKYSCQFKCHGCFVSLGLEMTKQRGRADAANLISLWFGTMIRSLCFKVFKVLLGWKTLPDKTWQVTLQGEPCSYIGVTMKSFAWMSVHIIKIDMVELNIDF